MRYTKKLLKGSFEKGKIGLGYLKAVANKETAPVLFVKGGGASDFVHWMDQLFDDSIVLDKKTFEKEQDTLSNKLVIVEGVRKLRDNTIEAAMNCRKRGVNVVVGLKQHPKILDYVVDPSFKLIEVMDFNSEIYEEIQKVRKKIG